MEKRGEQYKVRSKPLHIDTQAAKIIVYEPASLVNGEMERDRVGTRG